MFLLPANINSLKGKTISNIEMIDGQHNVLLITFTDGDLMSLLQTGGGEQDALITIWRKKD